MPTAAKTKTISYHALNRARTTIEDFVLSYFPLYGLSCREDFFRFWDILVFVEASIYEMDEENEALTLSGNSAQDHRFQGEEILCSVLREKGFLSDKILDQLAKGKEYWRNERHLCSCMLQTSLEAQATPFFTVQDVHRASENKSFDYRVLHLLLAQLIGKQVNEELLAFLFLDEHLVDIGDDLVKRISDFEQRHLEALAKLPQVIRDKFNERREEASAVAGSEKWKFPRPIFDEHRFRTEMAMHDM